MNAISTLEYHASHLAVTGAWLRQTVQDLGIADGRIAGWAALLMAGAFTAGAWWLWLIERSRLRPRVPTGGDAAALGREASRAALGDALMAVPLAALLLPLGSATDLLAGRAAWLAPGIIWLLGAGLLIVLTTGLLRMVAVIAGGLMGRAASTPSPHDDLVVELGAVVAKMFVIFLSAHLGITWIMLVAPEGWSGGAVQLRSVTVILLLAGAACAAIRSGDSYLRRRFRIDVANNLEARRIVTQIVVLRRLAFLLIGLLAMALVLMQFEAIRRIGTSILASAGLAGVILGFAAQKTLGNLLAGIQIAMTQPIRIDDALIIDNEFGRVEEITLTYVVLRLWDQRRLIVPFSRIIEAPFQNWTRQGSQLLGGVELHCDYHVDVEALRSHARRLVEGDERWDRSVFGVQLLDWGPRTVTIRVLLSAADSGRLFDLRCAIREGMLRWCQDQQRATLPRLVVAGAIHAECTTAPGSAPQGA